MKPYAYNEGVRDISYSPSKIPHRRIFCNKGNIALIPAHYNGSYGRMSDIEAPYKLVTQKYILVTSGILGSYLGMILVSAKQS